MYEKKRINEGILWLEKCKEISPCCLNNILNSNHVQSDNEDDACALKSIFLYAFAHVHHSKSSYPWTLMIIGSEGKQSLEGFLNLTIYIYFAKPHL